jgi:hypothetical protein
MRRFSLFAVTLAGVAAVSMGQSSPAPQPTVAAGQSGLSTSLANGSGMQISTGTVMDYTAGQTITIRIAENNLLKLDLEKNVHIDGLVAPGLLAAIMWTSDGAGKRRVTSITAAPGPGDAGMANLESSYQSMSEPARAKGPITPGPSSTSPPTILTPQPRTTPRATATPSRPRPTPTPAP